MAYMPGSDRNLFALQYIFPFYDCGPFGDVTIRKNYIITMLKDI